MSASNKVSIASDGVTREQSVVSHEEWLAARVALLGKEKEFTKLRDELSRKRRELPWEKVEKQYVFDGPNGKETLAQLFGKHSQLIVYHFMFSPDWEAGCKSCSFWSDHFDAACKHLSARDTSLVVISRAPLSKLEPLKQRLGWRFKWLSSGGTDFNYDYFASFTPEQNASKTAYWNYAKRDAKITDHAGLSVFYKAADGAVYHTYSAYSRGIDMINGTYQLLDLLPKGRDEATLKSTQAWVQFHDKYAD